MSDIERALQHLANLDRIVASIGSDFLYVKGPPPAPTAALMDAAVAEITALLRFLPMEDPAYLARDARLRRKTLEHEFKRWRMLSKGLTPPPSIDLAALGGLTLELRGARLVRESYASADLGGAKIIDSDLTLVDIGSAKLDDARIDGCTFTNASLGGTSFERAKILRCEFGNADASNASFKNAFVKQCDFTGAKLTHAALDAADFEGCSFLGVSFDRSYYDRPPTTAHARFVDCDFTGADLADRDLTKVRFVRCKLSGVQPKSPRTIDGIELVDCDIDRDAFAERVGIRPMPAAGLPARYHLEAELSCADLRQRWRVSTFATFDHHPTNEEIERALRPEAEAIVGEGYAYDLADFVVKAG